MSTFELFVFVIRLDPHSCRKFAREQRENEIKEKETHAERSDRATERREDIERKYEKEKTRGEGAIRGQKGRTEGSRRIVSFAPTFILVTSPFAPSQWRLTKCMRSGV